ncbi:MAG: hypothetical protein ACRD3W_10875, partial [Terriglobales bacterium]
GAHSEGEEANTELERARQMVAKISKSVDADTQEALNEFIDERMSKMTAPQMEARLRQLSWVNDQMAKLSPDDAGALALTFAKSDTLIPAYMAGVRDAIPAGRIEVFVHGTTDDFAKKTVDQHGETLSGSRGDHGGRLFTTPRLDTGREFAQRLVDRNKGGEPALIGIALPAETAKWLERNKLMRTIEIHDRPGQFETIFEPAALPILKQKGFFFHLEGPTADAIQRANAKSAAAPNQSEEYDFRDNVTADKAGGDKSAAPSDVVASSGDFGKSASGGESLNGGKSGGEGVAPARDDRKLTAEEIARMEKQIADDTSIAADVKTRAVSALELARDPANSAARDAVLEARTRAGETSGGIDRVEGAATGVAMVALALGSWYLSYQSTHNGGGKYVRPSVS